MELSLGDSTAPHADSQSMTVAASGVARSLSPSRNGVVRPANEVRWAAARYRQVPVVAPFPAPYPISLSSVISVAQAPAQVKAIYVKPSFLRKPDAFLE
jgi:hypothetical protein